MNGGSTDKKRQQTVSEQREIEAHALNQRERNSNHQTKQDFEATPKKRARSIRPDNEQHQTDIRIERERGEREWEEWAAVGELREMNESGKQ